MHDSLKQLDDRFPSLSNANPFHYKEKLRRIVQIPIANFSYIYAFSTSSFSVNVTDQISQFRQWTKRSHCDGIQTFKFHDILKI